MVEKKEFAKQMARLAVIFQPGKFEGKTGQAALVELFRMFNYVQPADLEKAVSLLLLTYNEPQPFPRPAVIRQYINSAARSRQETTLKLDPPEIEKMSRVDFDALLEKYGLKRPAL